LHGVVVAGHKTGRRPHSFDGGDLSHERLIERHWIAEIADGAHLEIGSLGDLIREISKCGT